MAPMGRYRGDVGFDRVDLLDLRCQQADLEGVAEKAASVKRNWHLYLLLTLLFGLLPLVLALGSLLHRLIRPKKDALVSKEEQVVVQTTGPDGVQTEEVVQQQPTHSALDGAFDDVELGPVDGMDAHRASVPSYSFLDPMPVAE
ncbi:hypothetical protein LTR86_009797 [Recurvomyces mirabilis]|nr:hypothetical protein LTR86_009797 [Recurvomyces mirabilis]